MGILLLEILWWWHFNRQKKNKIALFNTPEEIDRLLRFLISRISKDEKRILASVWTETRGSRCNSRRVQVLFWIIDNLLCPQPPTTPPQPDQLVQQPLLNATCVTLLIDHFNWSRFTIVYTRVIVASATAAAEVVLDSPPNYIPTNPSTFIVRVTNNNRVQLNLFAL